MNLVRMFKKALCLVLITVMSLGLSSCALFDSKIEEMPREEAAPYLAMAEEFVNKLLEDDLAGCYAMFGEDLGKMKTRSAFQEEWEQMRLAFGSPVDVMGYETYRVNGEGSVVALISMTHGGCRAQFIYDKNDALAGLWFMPSEEPVPYTVQAPQGVAEQELTLGAGSDYPLRAVLTMPEGAAMNVPCVILVHDAGAYDLNSALGGCVPFADIAHGLALQGIATIRYDKRTFTHGAAFDEKQVMNMTVQDEVIADALLAVEAADQAQPVDSDAIYIAGHGLGGMLAPRIAVQSGGRVAGIISMGGTARDYLEMVYDQNLAMTGDAERKNAIKKEYKKTGDLGKMKDSDTVFGLPVPYLKDLYANPVADQLSQLSVPVLILHGKNDFQYSLDDYKSWQTALQNYAGESELVLFEDLNHLFVNNTGFKRRGTTAEYLTEAKVSQEVVDRIAGWIMRK